MIEQRKIQQWNTKPPILILGFMFFLIPIIPQLYASGTNEGMDPGTGNSLVLSETQETVTCRDADGSVVTLKKKPQRVVVNYVSFIGPWYYAGGYAIGVPDLRTDDNIPDEARHVASTGRSTSPNVERVLALNPDLLILSDTITKHRDLKELASGMGIPTLSLCYETYADYLGILDLFFRLNGRTLEDAQEALAIGAKVDSIIQASLSKPAQRFASLFVSSRSIQVETNRAHTAYMASLLGGENIVAKEEAVDGQSRVALSLEHLVMEDPDLILVTFMGDTTALQERMEKDYFSTEPWLSMQAVKNRRIHYLPDELFLYKPNQRFPEAFEQLYQAFHPQEGQ